MTSSNSSLPLWAIVVNDRGECPLPGQRRFVITATGVTNIPEPDEDIWLRYPLFG